MIERKIFRFGAFFLVFVLPLCALAQKGEKIQTIVIDPGHGGKDTGALGKVSKEKTLNLAVALKFGNYIKENMPDVKVVYTREKDKFVELSERAAIANRNDADVFISIHCNSTGTPNSAYGAETFVMGESKNEKNLAVAKKENAAILLEDNTDAYDNFDPNSTEAYILFSLSQSLYQSQSLDLADKVQKQFTKKAGRHDRGVQQAGFLVLWKTSMPSILVELGFINNAKEEQFLNSEKGQTQLALALYRAFEEYKREFEAENSTAVQPVTNEKTEKSDVGDTYFSVQFASRDKKVSSTDKTFSGVKEVEVYEYGGAFRYISGRFTSKDAATKRQAEVRALGYKDAFVIAFINGERGTVKQAEEALKK
ncbi:MAG: N-acetylmuramoyl-L-alanine amidase [Bacteroidales bacterium]|nr:N-acetylmuramoyl-L-alanine amidase [Bacteroidales bacterium]